MSIWFIISVIGVIAIIPLYFLSLEHEELDKKYGKEKGKKIGSIYGMISGWTFFLFWFGLYFSPQPRFTIPLIEDITFGPLFDLTFPLVHILISIPFIVFAFYFGLVGVKGTSLETAETHRAKEVADSGIYSIVRHPQYLGGLLGHFGISILLSAFYGFITFPVMVVIVYIISRKEELEMIIDFGEPYENYRKQVPMLIPKLRRKKTFEN